MRVVCPSCSAAYNVDDRKVPPAGLTVRCPKCQQTFPVRLEGPSTAGATSGSAVPLPGTAPRAAPGAGVPLPPPAVAPATGAGPPLPPPTPEGFASADADTPFGDTPFADTPFGDTPFGDTPFGDAPATEASPEPSFDDGPSAFDAGPYQAEPGPFDAGPAGHPAASDPASLGAAPAPAGAALGFGEIDFEVPSQPPAPPPPPAAAKPPAEDPFAELAPTQGDPFARLATGGPPPPPPPLPVAPPTAGPGPSAATAAEGEELESLFGDAPAKKLSGWRVRRRSGRIFGPFEEEQIVEMLEKGELLGNEDVAQVGSDAWKPIGQVKAYADTMRKLTGTPAPTGRTQVTAFGDRMAAAEHVTADGQGLGGIPRKWVLAGVGGLVFLLLVGGGLAAGLYTPYGYFFTGLLRAGDPEASKGFVARARAELAKGDHQGTRQALDLAGQAVAAAPRSATALALQVLVVSALEGQHGAPAGALDAARKATERLEADAKGEPEALAARLALTLAEGGQTTALETALDQAASKRNPDPEGLALAGRAALARGDAARAATLFQRLDAADPKSPRGPLGLGQAAARKGDAAAARTALEKALGREPGLLPARLELAALAVAAGDAAGAGPHLDALLAPEAEPRLAPLERARALSLRASLLARHAATSAEAEAAWQAALGADGRAMEVRLALARHLLRRGEPAKAVATLDPLAQGAAQNVPVAALRVRALAAAGRALDAISLADAALAASPGEPQILLAKAAALEAASRSEEAAALYRDAAVRAPANPEPRLALARLALAQKEFTKAAAEIAAALEKGSVDPAVHVAAGELALATGESAAAQTAYRKALALDAECAGAEVGLARLAVARGDTAAATAGIERALAVEPRNGDAHALHGRLLWTAGDLAGAEKAYTTAVELQPRNAVALMGLGAVKFERGDAEGAIVRLTSASNEAPNLAEAHRWLGRALLGRAEIATALTQLRRAAELDPKDAENQLQLGIGLERSGALEEAVDAYKAAAAAAPGRAEPWERLAIMYANNNRCDLAVPVWEKASAAAPKEPRYRLALGDCKSRLGKHEEALRIFREVQRAHPAEATVHYRMARAVHESQGARAAFPYYERAARDEKDNPMPHYYLGFAYKERGQRGKAVQEFKRFLELKPDADEKKDIEAEIEDLGGTP